MIKKEVLVAGIPRCGTTYIFRSLAGLQQHGGSPKGSHLEALPILKAHSLAPPESFGDPWAEKVKKHVDRGGKVVFVFGDPVLAVVSTRNRRFDVVHAKNCGYTGKLRDARIFDKDCFNYERMFDSWMRGDLKAPMLAVRYETLPENLTMLDDFLDRKVRWLPWILRETKETMVSEEVLLRIRGTYASLISKVEEAPNAIQF